MPFWSGTSRAFPWRLRACANCRRSLTRQARAAAGRTRLPYAVANALTAAQLILSSMRRRTHTCGSHFRTDAPAQSMPGLLQPLRLDDEAETAVERPAAR